MWPITLFSAGLWARAKAILDGWSHTILGGGAVAWNLGSGTTDWVGGASELYNSYNGFHFSMDQFVLEPERKNLGAWNQSLKFEFRLYSTSFQWLAKAIRNNFQLINVNLSADPNLKQDLVCLTLWEPAYNIFVHRFQPKNSSLRLLYQHPSSFADCARELFKGSNGSASLLVCTRKKFFWLGVVVFLWVMS